ncbi:NAD(P)/FAD-dependent oxidoreductase [Aquabacterium sp. J223]|uniref:NAD(P)/FAD-dependent oxidoreductase n=1 Tax=Aquabacterium sp. J223 TaxID=2898431 RepID=UPI0021AE022B|nr:NAD(P)/FAD-dependent oxidoreductase [Aquabacterium sp. J223]UUX97631.1 NAD(P)/FAD-dependent oxidoreductase [Aquabacterium sp. J223]
MPPVFDAVVIGAGAAGLFCAGIAGQRGLTVLLLDHSPKVAEKVRISGGGRCNFTNRDAGPAHFLSENPRFARSALARYSAADFIALVQRHRIPFHEKHKGQLFCDDSSQQVIDLLLRECDAGGVVRRQPCAVGEVRPSDRGFEVDTAAGPVRAAQVVVATGGLPVPAIGATDFGLRLARRFGHAVVEPRPALVPLTFDAAAWAPFAGLAGVALPVHIRAGDRPAPTFDEDLLFTHRGLSGPGVLQASSHWRAGQPLDIDLLAGRPLADELLADKAAGARRQLGNRLAQVLPQRLAEQWLAAHDLEAHKPVAELRDRDIARLAEGLRRWQPRPSGTEGWKKAEVMAGGVDTRELSSQSLESRRVPGLHFIGEVVDVTGWLGGYNFQWAWASAAACGRALRTYSVAGL